MGIKQELECSSSRSNLSFNLARLVSLQFLLYLTQCAAQTTTDPYLLFANRPSIQRIELNGTGLTMLYGDNAGSNRYQGLDLDIRTGDVYVSMAGTIEMGHVDGMRNITTLLRRNGTSSKIESVAWDWINKKLYFTDQDRQTVEVLDPETGYSKVLVEFDNNIILPRRVIVDPLSRQLYWTSWHKDISIAGRVYRTSMDGLENTLLFDSGTGLIQPNGLALDYAQNNLYIVDVITDTIGRSTLSGNTNDYEVIQRLTSAASNGQLSVLEQNLPASYHASSMDFFNNELYFGDILRPPRLSKVNVSAPSGSTELVANIRREPESIRVVDISRQPEAINPCADNNGGCSYLCLLSSVSSDMYTCVCQEGVDPSDCVPSTTPGSDPMNNVYTPSGNTPGSDPVNNVYTPSAVTLSVTITTILSSTIANVLSSTIANVLSSTIATVLSGTITTPAEDAGSGKSFLSVTVVIIVVVLIVVVILLVIMAVVIAIIALKIQHKRTSKRRLVYVSEMSSPRGSSPHVTVSRSNDHNIKGRESPAPRGVVINTDAGLGSGGHYTIDSKSPLPSNLVLQNGGKASADMILDSHLLPGHPQLERNANIHSMSPLASNLQSDTNEKNGNEQMPNKLHEKKVKTAPVDSLDSDSLDWAHS